MHSHLRIKFRFSVLSFFMALLPFGGAGFAQQFPVETKVFADDAVRDDEFGHAVAISGDYAIASTTENDNSGANGVGAVYIYQRNAVGDKWIQIKKLIPFDGAQSDEFGESVAISGEIAVVGSDDDDNGNGSNAGSIYIFSRNQGGADNWGLVTKRIANAATRRLGFSVSISGDIIIAGASGSDDNGERSGAAVIFARNQGGADNWGEVKRLVPADNAASDEFGRAVAIDGDTAIATAINDDNSNGAQAGSAYIFARNQGGADNWGQVAKLLPDDNPGVFWGSSASISGDVAIVGYQRDDDNGSDAGAAYIFSRNQGGADNWGQVRKLLASDGSSGDRFGDDNAVSISGDIAVVGANNSDSNGNSSGAAYIFERNEGGADNWGQTRKLTPLDAAKSKDYGVSVAVNGDVLIVGADSDDDIANRAGAAYIYSDRPAGSHLRVAPTNVSLITIIGGFTASKTINLLSIGTQDVTVNGISDPGGEFSVGGAPSLIASGETATFNVNYDPVDTGIDNASTTVSSNDANDPAIAATLQGNGLNGAQEQTCYASTGSSDGGRLLTIDITTGAATLVSAISGLVNSRMPALAIRSDGAIFGADGFALYAIDPVTGEALLVSTDGFFEGMAFDENDVLYGSEDDALYRMDLNTGVATFIGSMDDEMAGLAFDPTDGALYASGSGDADDPDIIWTIDKTDASTTELGETGFDDATPDLHFDLDGNLYASKKNKLISVDKASGQGTLIGNFGISPVSGLAFFGVGLAPASPVDVVENVIGSIDDLLADPDLVKKAKSKLKSAKKSLTKAVKKLDQDKVSSFFSNMRNGVGKLEQAAKRGADVSDLIDELVELGAHLAEDALAEARQFAGSRNVDKRIRKVEQYFSQADAALAKGDFRRAIDRYKNAYLHSQKAIRDGERANKAKLEDPLLVAHEADDGLTGLPKEFALERNYPNPFNPSTTIHFALPQASEVKLTIYNVRGQVVRALVAGFKEAGRHQVVWDGRDQIGGQVASGVYFYRFSAQDFVATRKLLLTK